MLLTELRAARNQEFEEITFLKLYSKGSLFNRFQKSDQDREIVRNTVKSVFSLFII